AAQHLPNKRAAGLLAAWLAAPLSPGTLVAFVKDGADDLGAFLDRVHEQISGSPVVHFDETGVRAADEGAGFPAPAHRRWLSMCCMMVVAPRASITPGCSLTFRGSRSTTGGPNPAPTQAPLTLSATPITYASYWRSSRETPRASPGPRRSTCCCAHC